MRRFCVMCVYCCLVSSGVVLACSPGFPDSYVIHGGRDILSLPRLSSDDEMVRILPLPEDGTLPIGAGDEESEVHIVSEATQRTVDADIQDVSEALKASERSSRTALDLIAEYTAFRKALQDYTIARAREKAHARWNYREEDSEREKEPFNAAPYKTVLSKIPQEFELYARGAIAHHCQRPEEAVEYWKRVLKLPPDQRQYRTTWALYMLGWTHIKEDPDAAVDYFARFGDAVKEGARDSLKLTRLALGRQAVAEAKIGRFIDAIHHSVEFPGFGGLELACGLVFGAEVIDPALARDDVCLKVLTAWVSSGKAAEKWARAIEEAGVKLPLAGADRIAWNAYSDGNMAVAEQWLQKADPSTVYAQWVRAKLLLREGKIEEGTAMLIQLEQAMRTMPELPTFSSDYPYFGAETALGRMRGDLALLCLNDQKYAEALELFVNSSCFEDSYYVAECVMTTQELADWIEIHENSKDFDDKVRSYYGDIGSELPFLKHVLAVRLADQGKWHEALPYFPERTRPDAETFVAQLTEGRDEKRPVRQRAEALMGAAQTLREKGHYLMGRALMPDWRWAGVDLGTELPRTGKTGGASEDERNRVQQSLPTPMKRFHYRYTAADLMWEAAMMLPKNDVLGAKALYLGGKYLKGRDPEAADKFYKNLVRRNPNLEIAQQADKLRWFPAEFSDKILYRPLPYWSKRKIAAAAAGGCTVLAFALTVAAWGYRRRRRGADKVRSQTPGTP